MHIEKLNSEHIVELSLTTDSIVYLNEHGYPTSVIETFAVCSDSENGYLIAKIETLDKPIEFADAVEDQYVMYVCTCPAYRYGDGIPDLDTNEITDWEPCKHIERL